MHGDEAGALTTRESSKFGLGVHDQVVIARAVVLAEESVYVAGSPTFTEVDVGHGQAVKDGRVDC